MYTAEIKRYEPDSEQSQTFATWDEAADWIMAQRQFGDNFVAWIGDESVCVIDGKVVRTASLHPVRSPSMADVGEQFARLFRPQPVVGRHPRTLVATGKLEA